jgi:hypothetical protein
MKYGTWLEKLWQSKLWTGNVSGAISRDKDLLALNDSCDGDTLHGRIVLTDDLLCRKVLSVAPHVMERVLAS